MLDLFLPGAPSGAGHPLVIFVHGGGWASGSRRLVEDRGAAQVGRLLDALLDHGYAVASVDYRLTDVARFPAPVHDVKAATRHLRAGAARFGLDPDRFAAMGESAGGHLAAFLALTPGRSELEGPLGPPGVSSAVRALVDLYGVSDVRRLHDDRAPAGCPPGDTGPDSPEGRLLGGDPADPALASLAEAASPIAYVGPGAPPALLLHGSRDCVVPLAQSRRLAEALTAAGAEATLHVLDAGHADPRFYTDEEARARILAFLDAHL